MSTNDDNGDNNIANAEVIDAGFFYGDSRNTLSMIADSRDINAPSDPR